MIDSESPAGRRALRRLASEPVAWMTTVSEDGAPRTSPIWFLWEDGEVLVYSRAGTSRTRNLAVRPKVGFHLDGDGIGGDVVVLEGEAAVDPDAPPAFANTDYVLKYGWQMAANGWTPESFAGDYPVAVCIRVTRARVW